MKRLFKLLFTVLVLAVMTTGCAINRASAMVDPSAKLDAVKTIHVKHLEKDGRGIDTLIADNLRTRGYKVTVGNEAPASADALVTYADKWMWDITMYMIELTIQVRDPKTDYSLASGHSLHTSLTRKSPPEMVDEVVGNILKEAKTK